MFESMWAGHHKREEQKIRLIFSYFPGNRLFHSFILQDELMFPFKPIDRYRALAYVQAPFHV